MRIDASHISKKFGKQSIIRDFSHSFLPREKYVITGANGSGKSTLLKMLSGYLSPDSGTVTFSHMGDASTDPTIKNELVSTSLNEQKSPDISIYAPYIAPPNDLTVSEAIRFHAQFKPLRKNEQDLLELVQLNPSKKLTELSSGMKQRLQLAFVFFSKSEVLFLDEPTSFFDTTWKAVYHQWLNTLCENRTIILSSNDENEYVGFGNIIRL